MSFQKNQKALNDSLKNQVDSLLRQGMFCPSCGKWRTGFYERESINTNGECTFCDHIRGNILEDQEWEAKTPSDGKDYKENFESEVK